MRKTATTVRCMPRFGYDFTEVRTLDVDLPRDAEEQDLHEVLTTFFVAHGISDAVYDVKMDEYGFMAIINDEAYEGEWGTPLL